MKKLLIGVLAAVGLYLVSAVVMTFWPEPEFSHTPSLADVQKAKASGTSLAQVYEDEERRFQARDGVELFARRFVSDSDVTVLLLHGVTGQSGNLNKASGLIREASAAEVIALDLRGHGQSGSRRRDVDYIGQYAEDVADVVAEIHAGNPGGKVILSGHSMGGGIALRYAKLEDAPAVDGYLLFAPLLGTGSPTLRTEPAEGSDSDFEYMRIHLPRLFGLIMLNIVGIDWCNGLATLFFNLPPETVIDSFVDSLKGDEKVELRGFGYPVRKYSFRALASMAPEPYGSGLAAVDVPMLVLVGSNDEAFHAEEFEGVVSAHSDGEVVVIEGKTHDSLHNSAETMSVVRDWMSGL